MTRPACVLIAPWATRTEQEHADTVRAAEHLLALGWAPIFLPWALERVLRDERPEERSAALACSASLLWMVARDPHGDAFVLGGRETEGVRHDREAWSRYRAAWNATYRTAGGHVVPLPESVRLLTWTDADAPGGRR